MKKKLEKPLNVTCIVHSANNKAALQQSSYRAMESQPKKRKIMTEYELFEIENEQNQTQAFQPGNIESDDEESISLYKTAIGLN